MPWDGIIYGPVPKKGLLMNYHERAPGEQLEKLRRQMEEANQNQKRTEARMLELLHVLSEAADVIAQDQQALAGAGFENGMWIDAGLKERWEYLEGLLGRLARALGHEAR